MASRIVSRRFLSTTVRRLQEHEKQELKKEARRNPETLVRHNAKNRRPSFSSSSSWPTPFSKPSGLTIDLQVLGGVMVAALAGAGFYFGAAIPNYSALLFPSRGHQTNSFTHCRPHSYLQHL